MSATITKINRIRAAEDFITENFDTSTSGNTSHFYTGKSIPWDDEYSPDTSNSSDKEIYDTLYQRIFMKKIEKSDATLAIRRHNWITDTVYFQADFDVEYTDYLLWDDHNSPFYCINSTGEVYKCIFNNSGAKSTTEPTGTSLGYINLGDGYIWKFMLDLTTAIEDAFLTDNWIPIPYETDNKSFNHLAVEGVAVEGDIKIIKVTNAGVDYPTAPTIQIRGNGTGATATAIMSAGSIESIQITSAGSGYTHAEIFIFGAGIDGAAEAMISPPGGHGSDAASELGAFYVEVAVEIIGTEDGFAPITGTYRNIGIAKNTKNTSALVITDEKLNTLSTINIINCSGTYLISEVIIGTDSEAQGVVYYDPSGTDKDVTVYMIDGTFIDGENIYGQDTGIVGEYVEASSTITTVDIWSGDILYKENIIFITRREVQTEDFVFTIEF